MSRAICLLFFQPVQNGTSRFVQFHPEVLIDEGSKGRLMEWENGTKNDWGEHHHDFVVGGFNPNLKNIGQNGNLPKIGMIMNNYLKSPPSFSQC